MSSSAVTAPVPDPRRRAGVGAGLLIMTVVLAVAILPTMIEAADQRPEPVAVVLPAPTGARSIGTFDLHLIDEERTDPWAAEDGPRELMVSVWYPAVHDPQAPATPYLPGRIASFYDQASAELGITRGMADFRGAQSHAQTRAMVDQGGPWPVLLYSPGGGQPRALATTVVEELTSQGFVVVTVDATYQAPVEFPDGLRMPVPDIDVAEALAVRVADVRFVRDQLDLLVGGVNPDRAGRPLPAGLGAGLDLSRVGVFGHSIGGFAAFEILQVDGRFAAGANLDGSMRSEYRAHPDAVVEQPFLLVGAGTLEGSDQPHDHLAPDWSEAWRDLGGWKRNLYLRDAEHLGFTDLQVLLPDLARRLPVDREAAAAAIGTIDPSDSLAVQRTYLVAFFTEHLKGVPQPVLDRVPDDLAVAELVE